MKKKVRSPLPTQPKFLVFGIILNISSNKSITKHIIVGNFNLDSVKWDDSSTSNDLHRKFVNLFEENCLTQILRSPTHYRGNVLDLLFTDDLSIIKDICTADHYEYIQSDHFDIQFNIDIKGAVKRLQHPKRSVRNFKKADWLAINNDLSRINRSHYIDYTDINTAWCNFKGILNNICDQHIPKITLKNCNNLPWYDAEVDKLNCKKERLRSQYKSSQNPVHYRKYSQARRELKNLIKTEMQSNLFDDSNQRTLIKVLVICKKFFNLIPYS